jgi:hypothetical protein
MKGHAENSEARLREQFCHYPKDVSISRLGFINIVK